METTLDQLWQFKVLQDIRMKLIFYLLLRMEGLTERSRGLWEFFGPRHPLGIAFPRTVRLHRPPKDKISYILLLFRWQLFTFPSTTPAAFGFLLFEGNCLSEKRGMICEWHLHSQQQERTLQGETGEREVRSFLCIKLIIPRQPFCRYD